MALCCLALTVGAWPQDSADSGEQTPLGDVVRRQQEQRQHSKTAKRVVSDDDIPTNHMNWMNGQVAEFVIIPAIRISGLTPNDSSSTATALGQKKDKIYVGFGPHLGERDWCGDGSLECAENSFLRRFQGGGWVASSARILFDSDAAVGDYASRVAHFEILHDTRGKMQGSVALIETPIATLMAYCIYNAKDHGEAEPQCDAFISSLRVEIPKRYVYVHHQQ
jgi:hypothetical protein